MKLIRRNTYDRLNEMVDKAIDGTYQENDYDESELSRLEVKWMRYLNSAALSHRKMEEERSTLKGLIADISHQTRTPLANMKLYSELLKEQELDEPSRNLAEKICEQSNRLEFLIEALVKMSRLEMETVQVNPVRHRMSELMECAQELAEGMAFHKNICIEREPFADGIVYYDEKWTAEAIGNLLDNAIKYSSQNGKILLRAQPLETFFCFSVTDFGIGIDETEQAQIFHRFYRSPRVQQEDGIGLGLYLARKIITLEGGFIKVRSRKEQGSTFCVYLPRERR